MKLSDRKKETIKTYCSPEGYENIPLKKFPKTVRAAYNYRLKMMKYVNMENKSMICSSVQCGADRKDG